MDPVDKSVDKCRVFYRVIHRKKCSLRLGIPPTWAYNLTGLPDPRVGGTHASKGRFKTCPDRHKA